MRGESLEILSGDITGAFSGIVSDTGEDGRVGSVGRREALEALAEKLSMDVLSMKGEEQSPVWHAEGDVWEHSMRVVESLLDSGGEGRLRELCLDVLAGLLHDVAKPAVGVVEDGVRRHPGHAKVGARMSREILWRAGLCWEAKERICRRILWHLHPFFLFEKDAVERERILLAAGAGEGVGGLARLARADVRGRECGDKDEMLFKVDLFEELAGDLGVMEAPYGFADDHSQAEYFANPGRWRDFGAHDSSVGEVIILSGLPGAGKSSWVKKNWDGSVISLDEIRRRRGVDASNQARVAGIAREEMREFLRQKKSFVYDSTALTRDRRAKIISLGRDYGFRVRVMAFELGYNEWVRRDGTREAGVGEDVLSHMLGRWEFPSVEEGIELAVVSG